VLLSASPSFSGAEESKRGIDMARVVALPLVLMLVGGCASRTTEVRMFQKPGMTDPERQRDQRECLSEAIDTTESLEGPIGNLVHLDRGTYEACMERRGYTLRIERR
jgi:hypothetical protein